MLMVLAVLLSIVAFILAMAEKNLDPLDWEYVQKVHCLPHAAHFRIYMTRYTLCSVHCAKHRTPCTFHSSVQPPRPWHGHPGPRLHPGTRLLSDTGPLLCPLPQPIMAFFRPHPGTPRYTAGLHHCIYPHN